MLVSGDVTMDGHMGHKRKRRSEINMLCYNDIAQDQWNPFKGQIFHETSHKKNVYPGSEKINVKGGAVTANAFYGALTGVPTTSEDYVYIYYDNHGGPGIPGVPSGDFITTESLCKALLDMEGKYKKCLFRIEACYSGSLAQEFKAKNLGKITAANDHESSYAAVYDSEVGTYLSQFTNYWLDQMYKLATSSTL